MRGGFLAGSNADLRAVNPFGVSAIAALVGAYADQAFQKLYEIFQTLFQTKPQAKSPDPRADNLAEGPKIKTKTLPTPVAGTAYSVDLEADGGAVGLIWEVNPLPAWLRLQGNKLTERRRPHHQPSL